MTPQERSIRARIANHALQAKYPAHELTVAATKASQTALNQRLIDQYGLDVSAPDFEVRLKHARSAHYGQMALKSAKTRARKALQEERGRMEVSQ
jgi:hypothetical protein